MPLKAVCPADVLFLRMVAAFAILAGTVSGGEVPAAAGFRKDIEPLLKEYCYDCHGDGARKGNVAFDELKPDETLLNHELWQKVLRNTRAGLMPPQKKSRPTPEQQKRIEDWIKYSAFSIDPKNPDPGRVTVRRLNRVEYRNTVHDLLGVDFNADAEFPPDDTGYGFDNIGDVLSISPMLLEKYLAAAKSIVGETVPVVSGIMPERVIPGSQFRGENAAGGGGGGRGNRRVSFAMLPFDALAAISNSFRAPQSGTYKVTVDLTISGAPNLDSAHCRVLFKCDGGELLNQELGGEVNKTLQFNFEQEWQQGEHALAVELQPLATNNAGSNALQLRFNSVTVRGPMDKKYWPKPPNYDRFFPRQVPLAASERRQYARELLANFAAKAFRRPADPVTVDRLAALAESVYSGPDKTFEAGIAHAMVAVLASPRFLFRMEESEKHNSPAGWSLVDDYSLASRLSYFLWSSMPDEELIRLAGSGQLRKNLGAQVTRMLADSRSEALVVNFTGQWLQARDVPGLVINARTVFAREAAPPTTAPATMPANTPNVAAGSTNSAGSTNLLAGRGVAGTPQNLRQNFGNVNGGRGAQRPPVELDAAMKKSMQREVELYFSTVLREDRSVLEFIQSDYVFANSNLAKVYGLTNQDISGNELRRVTLPADSPRGGLLTSGAILAVTSTPERTSPVKRGLFVLNNILGLPVPPPPPDIPALEVAEKDFKGRQPTLREALEIHRENALCASCHSRMDPIGLGMENFNALGVWRDKERGQTIEAAGKLVTGESFSSVKELKDILVANHKTDFYRCLTEKLLTYALGRGPEYYDAETVDQIVERLVKENGRFSALIHGIIESAPFQKQRNRANDILTENRESSTPDNSTQTDKRKASP